jgi:hypothetical protein
MHELESKNVCMCSNLAVAVAGGVTAVDVDVAR